MLDNLRNFDQFTDMLSDLEDKLSSIAKAIVDAYMKW